MLHLPGPEGETAGCAGGPGAGQVLSLTTWGKKTQSKITNLDIKVEKTTNLNFNIFCQRKKLKHALISVEVNRLLCHSYKTTLDRKTPY